MASKRCTNDLHELDLNTLEWKKVVPNNYLDVVGTPRPMYGARMVAGDHSVLVMYGGMISPDQTSGDLFIYDILNGNYKINYKCWPNSAGGITPISTVSRAAFMVKMQSKGQGNQSNAISSTARLPSGMTEILRMCSLLLINGSWATHN